MEKSQLTSLLWGSFRLTPIMCLTLNFLSLSLSLTHTHSHSLSFPLPSPPYPSLSFLGTFAVVELMIGNAIDRTLDSIGRSDCHSEIDGEFNTTATMLGSSVHNDTVFEDCDSLKVEMAVTLAFLTGTIMVHTVHSMLDFSSGGECSV